MPHKPKILVPKSGENFTPLSLVKVLFAQDGSQGRGYSDPTKERLQAEPDLDVAVCCNVGEVLWVSGLEPVDILISDCRLPHGEEFDRIATFNGMLTGISLYSRIRAMNSSLFIIMFTTQYEELVKLGLETSSDPNLAVVKAEGVMDEQIIQIIEARFPTRFSKRECS